MPEPPDLRGWVGASRAAEGLPPSADPAQLSRAARLLREEAAERAARVRVNANRVGAARAELKRELARGPSQSSYARAAEVIAEPPDWAKTWPVGQLLAAVRGLGSVRLVRAFDVSGVGASTALGELSEPQREALVVWLRAGARPRADLSRARPRGRGARE